MVCKINLIETAQVQPPEYDEIRPAEPAISESAMDTLNVVMVDQMRSKLRIFRKMANFVTKISEKFGPKCVKYKNLVKWLRE